ncbi:ABC1 kinase family protein [Actinokineospora sp. 24-640]
MDSFASALFGTVVLVVVIAGVAVGARRMLGLRVGPTRMVVATVVAFITAALTVRAVPEAERQGAFLTMVVGVSLLVTMSFLVLAEMALPNRSRPVTWSRAVKRLVNRGKRYGQIARIVVRHRLHRAPSARALRTALQDGGVTFVKLGQMLATRPDLMPAEYTVELSRLQYQVDPAPWSEVEPVLVAEFGMPLTEVFAEFDPVPLAAASIAQVHTARLHCGREVVVKVQRPGIRPMVERDLDILRRVARTLGGRAEWARTIGARELAEGFAAALLEELDFRVEAANIVAIGQSRGADGLVVLPDLHEDLCGERVMVMDRMLGTPVAAADFGMATVIERTALARALLEHVLQQVMTDGVFHCDPHPGNVLLLDDGRVGLLDFGVVGRLDGQTRTALTHLLQSVERGDRAAMCDSLLEVLVRPDDIDEARLERALGQFLARHFGTGTTPDLEMFTALFRLVAGYGLSVPPAVAAVFRALATLEYTLARISPGFGLIAESRAFAGRERARVLTSSSVGGTVTDELLSMLPMLRQFPRRVARITSALEHGRLGVTVRLFAHERERRHLTGLVHQGLLAVLGAAIGIMAVMLLGTTGGPSVTATLTLHQVFGYNLLVISAALMLRGLVRIFRGDS